MKQPSRALGFIAAAWLMAFTSGPLQAQSLACLIEPNQTIELGSPVIGVLESVPIERGQSVSKGQVLATLQAGVERRAVELAQTRVQAEAELEAAQSSLELARRKHERTESLVQQNFVSSQALDQSRTEARIAERTVARAREQRRLAQNEWQVANAQLAQRSIRSPFDGVVVEKYLSAGERVDERPIARIASIDPLRVEVLVPAAHFTKFRSGLEGTVVPDLPGAAPRKAVVTLVDGMIDSASNTFRVRLRLDNADRAVPAGARCKVAFAGLDLQPSAQVARPPAAAPARVALDRPRAVALP